MHRHHCVSLERSGNQRQSESHPEFLLHPPQRPPFPDLSVYSAATLVSVGVVVVVAVTVVSGWWFPYQ